jgi:precorrin-2 dehydrogenase/sirohydrochlorin ferrochelatase
MGYYAAFLDLGGKRCLVVGGGAPAEDKVRGLLDAGALVTVVSDGFTDGLRQLAASGPVSLCEGSFSETDLDGVSLVIDASQDDPTGIAVSAAARARGILVNVLDRPTLCDFIAPAVVKRGPLQLAVSTAGRSPFMASSLRRRLERDYGAEWGLLVELIGELRDRLRAAGVPLDEQTRLYERALSGDALELLRAGDVDAARSLIMSMLPATAAAG